MAKQEADVEWASWLADAQVPFSLVFTKTDKRKKGVPSPQQNIEAFQGSFFTCLLIGSTIMAGLSPKHLTISLVGDIESCISWQAALLRVFEHLPAVYHTDSLTSKGQPELLSHIAQIRILQAGK